MSEREFFEGLGFIGDKPMTERRDGGFITEIRGRAEYRTEHLVLPPGRSAEEYQRQLERLLFWCHETDRLEALTG